MEHLTPSQIKLKLDKHIIGQEKAKRAVAIALRNRYRRLQIEQPLCNEITPKNILMIGPTGVGKTEIAKRLAKLANAPFIKVEATKFTEIGYVGRDVESIIRDLVDVAVKNTRMEALANVQERATEIATQRILDILLPSSKNLNEDSITDNILTRDLYSKKLQSGELDEQEIEIETAYSNIGVEIMAPPGMEEMTSQLQNIFQNLSGEKKRLRKMKVKDALKFLSEEESSKLISDDDLKRKAVERVEQAGIVFIDEIDKIAQRSDGVHNSDISREGVQRDLLQLIEGSTVSTKYGMVKTDHILFITSGAFHFSKPSDLIPELQGRLPIRVELDALTTTDFIRILTEPNASLTEQYKALLKTENINLVFTENGIQALAKIAWEINEKTENIGARRLHTVLERALEDISFNASDLAEDTKIIIDEKYVLQQLEHLSQNEDLAKFIL